MSAMSNTFNQLLASDAILEKIKAKETQITTVRQLLRDLETERTALCQQYDNDICARAASNKDRMSFDRGSNRNVMTHDPHTQSRNYNPIAGNTLGPVSVHGGERLPDPLIRTSKRQPGGCEGESDARDAKRLKSEWKYDSPPIGVSASLSTERDPKGRSTTFSSIPDAPSSSGVFGDWGLVPGGKVPPQLLPSQYPPRPPTDPFPFPEDIDIQSYPSELKHEEWAWTTLFNPSPKVRPVLDVNLVHTLVHGKSLDFVKFSQDGNWLATGCDEDVQIYDVKTGIKTCVLFHGGPDISVFSACFSPDGKYLATGAKDCRIRVWNIAKRQISAILEGHNYGVKTLQFFSNGQLIISVTFHGEVRIWDCKTSKPLNINDHYASAKTSTDVVVSPDAVTAVTISPDERYVALGSRHGVVTILELPMGALVQRLRGHTNIICSLVFTPNGEGLMSGSLDMALKHWDVRALGIGSGADTTLSTTRNTSPCLMNLTNGRDSVGDIAISPDGTWVISEAPDNDVLFWDARTGVVQCILHHEDLVFAFDLSRTGKFLATGTEGGIARIWRYVY